MNKIAGMLQSAFAVIGVTATISITEEDGVHEINIDTNKHPVGNFQYFARQDLCEHVVNTILGEKRTNRLEWVVSVIVQKDGGYWDPPYEDELDVTSGPSLSTAVIDATMRELSLRMCEAAAPLPVYEVCEIDEELPQ